MTTRRASFLIGASLAFLACGGSESGDAADASATDTRVDEADIHVCPTEVCIDDPTHRCCTEACVGAPCDPSAPACPMQCGPSGYRGNLYCTDGTWQAGLGLFPCSFPDAAVDADADAPTCSIGDALVPDTSCSASDAGCGTGEVCAVEVGGPMKRGATWCVTIPPECGGTPTCACMGACACGHWRCIDGTAAGEILCDDGTI